MSLLTINNVVGVKDFMLDADQGPQNARFAPPQGQLVTFAVDATAVNLELEVFAGKRTVVQRSAIPAGGTLGVPPKMNEQAVSFVMFPSEILQFRVRDILAAGTIDTNLNVVFDDGA